MFNSNYRTSHVLPKLKYKLKICFIEWASDLPVIALIPPKEICSFGGNGILQLLSWECLVCSSFEGFSKITLLKRYIRWLNFVINGQNMSAISLVPLDDLLKLMKTPSRFRICFGENNNCYPTHIQNRLLDVHWLLCIFMVKESSEANSREGRIEMRNKFPFDVFFIKVDQHIVHPWKFGWWRGEFHGRNWWGQLLGGEKALRQHWNRWSVQTQNRSNTLFQRSLTNFTFFKKKKKKLVLIRAYQRVYLFLF